MSSAYIDYVKNKNKCCKTIPGPQGPQGIQGAPGTPGTAVNRFNTTILTPSGALTADISTPLVVGYWWGVCNKSITETITLRLNSVNQITIPATTNANVGTTIRVGASSTTALYII